MLLEHHEGQIAQGLIGSRDLGPAREAAFQVDVRLLEPSLTMWGEEGCEEPADRGSSASGCDAEGVAPAGLVRHDAQRNALQGTSIYSILYMYIYS